MTFDGKLVVVTDEGWIVVLERDFSDYVAIALPGQEVAAAHNAEVVADGVTLASASWVRNSIAVDDQGGIYAVSFDEIHKVIWDGLKLSISPDDGAWSVPYSNGNGKGSGATPALMGYCDDRFVVVTDGEAQMNVMLCWRDEIPQDWENIKGQTNPRVAGNALVTEVVESCDAGTDFFGKCTHREFFNPVCIDHCPRHRKDILTIDHASCSATVHANQPSEIGDCNF